MIEISIYTEFIKLDSFLKLAGIAGTGGDAKTLIQEGEVKVNGAVCTMRGKKLFRGDEISFEGETFKII